MLVAVQARARISDRPSTLLLRSSSTALSYSPSPKYSNMIFLDAIHAGLLVLVATIGHVSGSPLQERQPQGLRIRPLVFWHGLGDSYGSPAMLECMQEVRDMHPGIFIHSIFVDQNLEEDRKAGFFGNVNDQIANVSLQLGSIPELSGGFDAIGFSQGGQFLRAYVERYNNPPIHNLITFGSQHMGVSDLPLCRPWDVLCQLARAAARRSVYTNYAQENLVQAQYFRDPERLPQYLANNKFLASINNEVDDVINKTYAKNLRSLNKLVLVLFSEDVTVVPKESSWFGSYAPSEDARKSFWPSEIFDKTIIPMRLQTLYTEDRIGLKTLDKRGDVVLETCEGVHMELSQDCWKPLIKRFVGGLTPKAGHDSVSQEILRVQ